MEKMRLETENITESNVERIAELFPNVVTEVADDNGNIKKGIDFEKLKQELSEVVVDGDERYDFTWVGKRDAMLEANKPIRKTLRPDRESSVNWENTQNIYIEGDNLEALKLLQESYLDKVKMIYIDPPYNTGKDFVYRDNFTQDNDSFDESINYRDEEGNINFSKKGELFQNTESNGKFHSDWCSMIYSRLKLARNLLSDDGVIFISIDDNEVDNLRKICDEIFGSDNFIANIIWEKKFAPQNDAKWFSDNHDHILCYSKNKKVWHPILLKRSDENNDRYKNPDNDPRGVWASSDLSVKTYSANYDYPIITPSGKAISLPPGRCWMTSKTKMEELIKDNRIWFGKDGSNLPRLKRFLSEVKQGITPLTIWYRKDVGDTQEAKKELLKLMPENVFQTPKPIRLMKHIAYLATKNDDIILDFFSGSATTAHAVMQLNAEDGGNRKFIMVQIPEATDEKSEAYKAGYKNICEIGKERIRRAGKKIQEEHPDKKLDIGFRVFKVDDTNMKDVYYSPEDYDQSQLNMFESNIKEDRTDEDLLYGCLLDWGVELSLPHKVEIIDGKRVHIVNDDGISPDLIACFEDDISDTVVKAIANKQPTRVVFRDSSFIGDDHKINVEEIFKLLSPNTTVKVI